MSRDRGLVREIDWLEVFPWLGLTRAMGIAAGPSKLVLALLGLMLTVVGWQAIARAYQYAWKDTEVDLQAAEINQSDVHKQPRLVDTAQLAHARGAQVIPAVTAAGLSAAESLAAIPSWYSRPFHRVFQQSRFVPCSMALLCGLWLLAVWAFCGGVIARLASARFAQDRRIGFFSACRHAIGKWLSYVGGPLFPIGAALLFAALALVAGWVARADAGFALVGAFWPIGLLCALVCAVLLVAALVSWPLMWSAISTESNDAFDSFNRSFSYATQRPFHLVFYVVVAGVMGAAAWLVVAILGELTIYLSGWAVGWGSGAARAVEIAAVGTADSPDSLGGRCVVFWNGLVRLLVLAYGHSYFWTSASGIYLLLRRDTDATPLDELYLDMEEDPYGLPPLRRDAAGVTVLDESQDRATVAQR